MVSMYQTYLKALLALAVLAHGQDDICPAANRFNYHDVVPQTIRSFQGIYYSNFNETITFRIFKPKFFQLDSWKIIPVLAQTAYGAVLTGSVYIAPNNSITWNGLGFSATGPYNCAFALSGNGSTAAGYYTYTDQKDGSGPAGETGEWLLDFMREPTWGECELVLRGFTAKDYETGCFASSG
ncbi:hypothetical protein LTR62_005275 [Meristemomyces frigidus]|uniref:Uncharacterized protein n=1 Tax=Meristemomyces frigidus TaxID=1508187 RepID=A0AAN7YNQ5_9PEZI|nr:hypothetical protein LTR62_005275 [Meristemomyces frigidus]